MIATITDPVLLTAIREATGPVELKDAAGRSIGVVMPSAGADLAADARRFGEDPMFDEWVDAVEEYRKLHNTVPEVD
jgi:hypothetical protein